MEKDELKIPGNARLLIKVTRDTLPQVKDKYPFLYLERGRLEIDDSSIKWIDCDKNVVRIPVATLNCLLLGPGTSLTHEAVKVISSSNCGICWVGEDSLLFFASGITPTSNTRNMRRQMRLAADEEQALEVARRMYAHRFPQANLKGKNLREMTGMEGIRVRDLYIRKAGEYQVGWQGRQFVPGKFEMSDLTNQILSSANAALYALLCSGVHSLGFSPHIGFIHSGSPLPFIYDLADLYKDELCIDLAFHLTRELAGEYNRHTVATHFRQRVMEMDLLNRISPDIESVLGGKHGCRDSE